MRRYLRFAYFVAALAALAVLAAGCGSKKSSSTTTTSTSSSATGSFPGTFSNGSSAKGGTYTVGWEGSFGFTDNFDPTGEYLGNAWGLYSNLMLRSLVGYQHLPGAAGNALIGDLATAVPVPTDNGLTYTYHLRTVKWAPPVNRAVTSKDVAYAMNRLANPKDGGQYPFYYTVIKGWDAVASGKAKAISGISTPDNNTIVFHLTTATGDFNRRMSMPATAPIPAEVGACFEGKPGDYGRNVISNGPYMIKGATGTFTSCAALKQFSGYAGANGSQLILVRNPNYDQSTDPYRKNYPDQFNFVVNSNADDIFAKVLAGQYQDEVSTPTPKVIRQYATTPSLKPRMIPNVGDRTNYITMNLTQPPFDDIHVRKAMNYIIDKAALQKAWGGPIPGSIATHIVPPVLYNGGLAEYDPYATANSAGDVAKAAAEMKQSSKYDPGKTGKCTAPACRGVLLISDVRSVDKTMAPIIQNDAAKIGITFTIRSVNGAYPVIQKPSNNIPISDRSSWGKDYADPFTFFAELFNGRSIINEGNTNYSLVGITPAQATQFGVKGNVNGVPSVNKDIDSCTAELGQARTTCWQNLDKKLMTSVVPWVPYLWPNNVFIIAPNVTHWNYDQFTDGPAYSSVSIK